MKDKTLQPIIDEIQSQVSALNDVPDVVKLLLNLVETLVEKTDMLEQENKQLKNEINKLKGETTPPNVRKQTKGKSDHSSEDERKKRTKKVSIQLYFIKLQIQTTASTQLNELLM